MTDSVVTTGNNNNRGEFDSDYQPNLIKQNSEDAESNLSTDGYNNPLVSSPKDEENRKPTKAGVIRTLLFLALACVMYFYDLYADIRVVIHCFVHQKYVYGVLALQLIIIPTAAIIVLSSRMWDNKSSKNETVKPPSRFPWIMYISRQLVLPWRLWPSLRCAWKLLMSDQERDRRDYYSKLLKEEQDQALLNVVESFLETAPQLVLQVFFDFRQCRTDWRTIAFFWIGVIFLVWSMARYQRAVRLAQPDKAVISYTATAVLYIGYFGTIAPRIILINIAAINSTLATLVICSLIWIGWTICLSLKDGVHAFCRNKSILPHTSLTGTERIRIFFFAAILAVIYRFTFINVSNGPTRVRFTIYHILIAMENGTIIILWFTLWNSPVDCIFWPHYFPIVITLLYVIGIAAVAIYYVLLHPTLRVPFCV